MGIKNIEDFMDLKAKQRQDVIAFMNDRLKEFSTFAERAHCENYNENPHKELIAMMTAIVEIVNIQVEKGCHYAALAEVLGSFFMPFTLVAAPVLAIENLADKFGRRFLELQGIDLDANANKNIH